MESASWFSRSGIREAHSGGFNSVDVLPGRSRALRRRTKRPTHIGAGLAACGPADPGAYLGRQMWVNLRAKDSVAVLRTRLRSGGP